MADSVCVTPLIAGSSSAVDGSVGTGSQERRRRWGSAKQRSGSTSATTISSDVLKVQCYIDSLLGCLEGTVL